ncbi:MAG: hypothetical protein SXQ77_11660 [Halobacteria archaeon]|nr:hypothetical protein [Halobacteria archaeon]
MDTIDRIKDLVMRANPLFAVSVVVLPVSALIYALTFGSTTALNYVHVMTGVLWTGIDIFMGLVLGPVLGGMDVDERADVFERLVPKMTFLMPTLAAVTITAGVELAQRIGVFSLSNHWILAALVIATALSVQGFGVILPNEIRVYLELSSEKPNKDKISRLGMRNAKLGGVQGALQIGIVFVMANLAF